MKRCDGRYKELKGCSCHDAFKAIGAECDKLKAELSTVCAYPELSKENDRLKEESEYFQKKAVERAEYGINSDIRYGRLKAEVDLLRGALSSYKAFKDGIENIYP